MEFLQSDEMFKKISKSFSVVFRHKKPEKLKQSQPVVAAVDYSSLSLGEMVDAKRDYQKSFEPIYNPDSVEQGWNDWWKEKQFYHMATEELKKTSHDQKYVMVLPPPNVTGKLHIGHALMAAIEDCLVRYKRMRGFQCVYIPGLDHAGIATQSVVEKMLQKQGIHKSQLTREEFLGHIWKWKAEYGEEIKKQFNKLGCSFDYQREFFTMDEKRSEAVIETFTELYNRGLIYRANRLVNWSCRLGTAISNIEVDTIEVKPFEKLRVPGYEKEVEFGVLIEFAYKIKDSDEEIVVATTRIETMLGDVAVAVSSQDARYSHLIGK